MRTGNKRSTEWLLLAVVVCLSYMCGSANFESRASRPFNENHWQYRPVDHRPPAILDSSREELFGALRGKPAKILKLVEDRRAASMKALDDKIAAEAERCLADGSDKADALRLLDAYRSAADSSAKPQGDGKDSDDGGLAEMEQSERLDRILKAVRDDRDRVGLAGLLARREKSPKVFEWLRTTWLSRSKEQGLRDWVDDVKRRADLANAANGGLFGGSACDVFQALVTDDAEQTGLIKYANLYVPMRNALVSGEGTPEASSDGNGDYPLHLRSPEMAKRDAMRALCLMLASFCAAAATLWAFAPRANQLALPILCALASIGANTLYLYKDPLNASPLTMNFCFHVFLGLAVLSAVVAAFGILNKFRYVRNLNALNNIRFRSARMLAFGGLALAVLAVSWLFGGGRGGLSFLGAGQLSGPISALAILHLAFYLREVAGRMMPNQNRRFWRERFDTFLPLAVFCAILAGLFAFKKDLGPVLVLFYAFLTMFCVATRRPWTAAAGVFGFLPALYSIALLFPTWGAVRGPLERLEMLLRPFEATNIDIAASLWSFASGGRSGSGPAIASPSLINLGSASHNDFILSGIGEAYGLWGVALVVILSASLVFTLLFNAHRTHGLQKFLLLGSAAYFGAQTTVNALGVMGWLPMTGIPFSFVSYGGSSIVTGFGLLALCMVASHHSAKERTDGEAATSWTGVFYAAAFATIIFRAVLVMGSSADEIAARPALVLKGDGVRMFVNNPRLEEIRASLAKATILDAHGLPMATGSWDELMAHRDEYANLGLFDNAGAGGFSPPLQKVNGRYYPLGRCASQLLQQIDSPLIQAVKLGPGRSPEQYRQPESEKLKEVLYEQFWGFVIRRSLHRVGQGKRLADGRYEKNDEAQFKNDLIGLVPALRDRGRYPKGEYARLRNTPRQVRLGIDARLQMAVQRALEKAMDTASGNYGDKRSRSSGAACVMDVETGMVLASVSLPNESVEAAIFGPFYRTSGVMGGAIIRAAVKEVNDGDPETRTRLGKLSTRDDGVFQALLGSTTMKAAIGEGMIGAAELKRVILAAAALEESRGLNKGSGSTTNILDLGRIKNFAEAICNAMKPDDRSLKTGQDKLLRDAIARVIEAKSRKIAAAIESAALEGGREGSSPGPANVFAGLGVAEDEIRAALNTEIALDSRSDRVSAPKYPCPPGSIFKLVTAAAALDEPADDAGRSFRDFVIDCKGHYTFPGSVTVRDNDDASHGSTGMRKAMVKSCNVYFAMLGDALGGGRIHAAAKRLLDPMGEGETVRSLEDINRDRLPSVSYGQEVVARPIDMAGLVATIVNGGLRKSPCVAPALRSGEDGGSMVPASAKALRDAMIGVTLEGTAKDLKFSDLGMVIGGKTGTAEVKPERPHSWFVGFAQKKGKSGKAQGKGIAFAFLVENGGYGGRAAGAAVKGFLSDYRGVE
jgi:cell division protein FtsW (lipid II flippase)